MRAWNFSFSSAHVLLLASMVVPTVSDAALIERDFGAPGDALITYDTTSGLEWLDVDLFQGLSWNEVHSTYSTPGEYFGWRHATVEDVDRLLSNTGIYASREERRAELIYELADLIGYTFQGGYPLYTTIWGFTGTPEDSRVDPARMTSIIWMRDALGGFPAYSFDLRPRFVLEPAFEENPSIGHFLVRDLVPVPTPSTAMLLAFAVFAFRANRPAGSRVFESPPDGGEPQSPKELRSISVLRFHVMSS